MIVVFNEKGGVGKTNLAFSIAKDLNRKYITNDSSIVTNVYSNSEFVEKKIPVDTSAVVDLGGFLTRYVADTLNNARVVLVPTIADYNSMLKAIRVIDHVGADRSIVIANMIEKPSQLKEIQEVIHKSHPGTKILELKRSAIFRNGLENGMSATDMFNSNNLNKHTYKSVFAQYKTILGEVQ